jgi:hypothetical protein
MRVFEVVPLVGFALLGILMLALPTDAAERIALRCDLDEQPGKFVSQTIFVGIDATSNSAVVADNVSLAFLERPAEGQVIAMTERRLRVSWSLEDLKNRQNVKIERLDYSLTYNRNNGNARVVARPFGYSNVFGASGRCTPVDPDLADKTLRRLRRGG